MGNSADIPVIDISGSEDEVARQLVNAAEEHGFIYIRNIGLNITPESIEEAFQLVSNRSQSSSCNEPIILTCHPN
jgi:isopenicillin N synthase-like dioxygenase